MTTTRTLTYALAWTPCLLAALLLTTTAQPVPAAEQTVLKGRVIRSLSVDAGNPQHILAGQKGAKPGTALVFESRDGGGTWRTLNGAKPLSPQASDVQAVVRVKEDVILAGTWKQGLYRSADGGSNFLPVQDFPSSDIRDLEVLRKDGRATVFAATARHGVFRSDDEGLTWQALGPGQDFFWGLSVSPSGEDLYAVSLEQAVYRAETGGNGWAKIFSAQNAYGLAVAGDARTLAIAAEAGVFLSSDAGTSWRPLPALAGEKFADALFLGDDLGGLLLASWSDGLVVLDADGAVVRRLLKGIAVVHLQIADDALLVGTWGKGLRILPLETLQPGPPPKR